MNKDQAIGGAILAVCLVVAVGYIVTLFYPDWLISVGLLGDKTGIQFWIIAIPVFIAFIVILAIGAWIGYTMATTPPPKPIEEITTEMQTENKPSEENKS